MMSKTGWRSVGELLITRRISLVAVCCSSASLRSRLRASSSVNRRTFSMAMTAWSAKVLSSSICSSENGRTSRAATVIDADRSALSQHRHRRDRFGSRTARVDLLVQIVRIELDIGNVDDGAARGSRARTHEPGWGGPGYTRRTSSSASGVKLYWRDLMDQLAVELDRRR